MNKTLFSYFLALLIFVISIRLQAQNPDFIQLMGSQLSSIKFGVLSPNTLKRNRFIFYPRLGYEYNMISKLNDGGQELDIRTGASAGVIKRNYYAGMNVTLYKPNSFFGASFDLCFVNKTYHINQTINSVGTIVNHRMLGVSPMLLLKLRTGDITKRSHYFVNFGAAYNYYFNYEQSIKDNSVTINTDIKNINPFNTIAVVGIGYELTPGGINEDDGQGTYTKTTSNSFFNIHVRYHHNIDQIFNAGYKDANGNMPYQNWKTNIGYLTIGFVIRGSMNFQKSY